MNPSHANELKQQGALEAAKDPNSSVTPEAGEQKAVDETRKAGIPAYQFDPDASPEQKALAARSEIAPGFHREKKSKAAGAVTDINGGPDQYDLPPPSKAGAITTTSKEANGSAGAPNGVVVTEDDARWIERAGWAPRFGPGDFTHDSDEPSLLDHQTWLEGKIADKYFGDWYHNAGIIVVACLSSWFVAVIGGGLGWIFIIMAFCGTYYRTSIRRTRRNFRDDINREMAKAKLETDNESLEWMNSFLVKFWPIFAPVISETVISSVDQVLSTATPAFLDSLRLKSFILGTKPPRMEFVKSYPKAEDDIVLMDWRFSFTPNDVEDLTSKQIKNKINPKVVLEVRVGKGIVSKGLDVIVEDMAFSGLMRLKIKLQIPFPHVERIEMCFLGRPTIDYVCKPIGGETLGFDINFIPGLESFIMEQIHSNLAPIMYDPNVFPIEVAQILAGNPVDQAIGVLAVTIYTAHGLRNPDKFSGTPDPYVVVSLNNREDLGKTKIVKQNANPRWNETIFVILTSLTDSLTLNVYDFNDYRKDKELGTATFALDQLENNPEQENVQLDVTAGGKARGVIAADIRYFGILKGPELPGGKTGPPPESNTGIARFTVEQAKDLDGSKSMVGKLNPYAVLLLNGKEVQISKKLKRTNNPIFENSHKELLITDRKHARLGVVIKDDRDLSADLILGTYQIKLDDMLEMMEKGQDWFNLAGTKSGRVKMTLQWKPVALKGALGGSGGYVTPIGVMRFHLQNGRDLRNVDTIGKSDPYARVLLSGIEKGRTVTFDNNLNPDWDEVIYVPVHSPREKITLEVMDSESYGKDRSLGLVELTAADYVVEGENGEWLAHDEKRPQSAQLRMNGRGTPKGLLNYTVSFYPCLNVADPEEEEEEKKIKEEQEKLTAEEPQKSSEKDAIDKANEKSPKVDGELAKKLDEAEQQQRVSQEEKKPAKIHLTPEQLLQYESGLLIFKLLEAEMTHVNSFIEVLIDDNVFPAYSSSKVRSRHAKLDEVGDTMVRELDVSRITVRLRERIDGKGEDKKDATVAKLTGNTLDTLKQCLNNPTWLSLRDNEGGVSKIKVSLKYIPIKMVLDPSESINNMGQLRVDVLDAANLPAADRSGYSDPYCKFILNGKDIFKTKVQKKTLHPAWNEFFEVGVPSRTAADFKVKVFDWDFGDKADFLGEAAINLELLDPFKQQEINLTLDGKSGTIRLRLLFKPDYITRSRQGTSTFSGTFATPGKVITGVAGVPMKGAGMVGGGVVKGASFIRHGFKSKKRDEGSNGFIEAPAEEEVVNDARESSPMPTSTLTTPNGKTTLVDGIPDGSPQTPAHSRSRSIGAQSITSLTPGHGVESGTAHFTVLSASGYPPSANVRVHIRQIASKGAKDIFKTKAVKGSSGQVRWENESFNFPCAADTQFQIQVKGHSTFGSDDDLGEALFFIDDSESGSEKSIQAGTGSVILKTSFTQADAGSIKGSPRSVTDSHRRSFLSRKGRGPSGTGPN